MIGCAIVETRSSTAPSRSQDRLTGAIASVYAVAVVLAFLLKA